MLTVFNCFLVSRTKKSHIFPSPEKKRKEHMQFSQGKGANIMACYSRRHFPHGSDKEWRATGQKIPPFIHTHTSATSTRLFPIFKKLLKAKAQLMPGPQSTASRTLTSHQDGSENNVFCRIAPNHLRLHCTLCNREACSYPQRVRSRKPVHCCFDQRERTSPRLMDTWGSHHVPVPGQGQLVGQKMGRACTIKNTHCLRSTQ